MAKGSRSLRIIVNALNKCVYDNISDAHKRDGKGTFSASRLAQKETNKFVSYKIVLALVIISQLLTGAIFHKAEILSDKPLIDLDELLKEDSIGQPGSTDSGNAVSDKYKDKVQKESDSDKAELDDTSETGAVNIVIRDKMISCNGRSWSYNRDTGTVAGMAGLMAVVKGARAVVIKDDYAESHALKYVVEEVRKAVPGAHVESAELFSDK